MTTIVYNHKQKQVAYDCRLIKGCMISSDDCEKRIDRGGIIFIMCGTWADCIPVVEAYLSNTPCKLNADGIMIKKGKAYSFGVDGEDGSWQYELNHNDAFGSGRDFGIAAMDFGKTAKQAVAYAMTRDNATGGKIKVIKL